jgi:hypothetical protein
MPDLAGTHIDSQLRTHPPLTRVSLAKEEGEEAGVSICIEQIAQDIDAHPFPIPF